MRGEEFGGGRGGEDGGGEAHAWGFGIEEHVAFGFELAEAALLPIGIDHGLDVVALVGRLGLEAVKVFAGEFLVFGGVFAWDNGGGCVGAVFQGVEAGDGLALDGAGSSGMLRISAVRGELSGGRHT